MTIGLTIIRAVLLTLLLAQPVYAAKTRWESEPIVFYDFLMLSELGQAYLQIIWARGEDF